MNFRYFTDDRRHLIRLSLRLLLPTCLLILLSIFLWDKPLATYFADKNKIALWQMARNVTEVGLGEPYFIALAILAIILWPLSSLLKLSSKYADQIQKMKAWTLNSFLALLFSGLCLHILKFSFGRKRPSIEPLLEAHDFRPFNTHWDFHSLPSGHSQVLFTVATMLSVLSPKLSPLWFILASLFAFTRVITYVHFLSDILLGAYVGVIATLWLLHFMKNRQISKKA